MNILGISAFYHDAAAALIQDGEITAAAQEERFTRRKHDAALPVNAMAYCLNAGQVPLDGIDAVAFYEKPVTKFVRLLKTYAGIGPRGFRFFRQAIPVWMREKLWIPYQIERALDSLGYGRWKQMYFTEHHESHAASAFFPSPFQEAAVLTMDAVGEWATASIGLGSGNRLRLLREMHFPHSVGMLYSAFTEFCGFRVNSGEYKLMGLAPYGEPSYVDRILEHVVDLHPDGSLQLDLSYFDYLGGFSMTNEAFADLFDGPPRTPESEITSREMDLARSIQDVTELIVMRMAHTAAQITGQRDLCLAGGVALNAVANGRLLREGPFRSIWIQPAAGDAGGSVGAAMHVWHHVLGNAREVDGVSDRMRGAYLGPAFSNEEIAAYLDANGYPYVTFADDTERARAVAELIAAGKVVGLVQGRMEFGPRALGNRSILADARSVETQSLLNRKIKFRESFRPFAPAVLDERRTDYFDLAAESPYMILVAPVQEAIRRSDGTADSRDIRERVHAARSEVPAVTHVDYSARVQTVTRDDNPGFHAIIEAFEDLTGCGLVVNTSFNIRGEPIVCTPADAYASFMNTGIDYLVLERCLLDKRLQPSYEGRDDWLESLVLD